LASEPLSPIDLLIAVLADPVDTALVTDPVLWEAAKGHAARHGVAQLVAYHVRAHLPPSERQWCDRVLTQSWKNYALSLSHLEQILGFLAAGGVPVLNLKGPLLASRHYQPPFLRKPSGDIDLAVRNSDLEKACAVFTELGYMRDSSLEAARARNHHLGMTHPSLPPVELHFRLSHGAYGVPVDEFFDRAVGCVLPGGRETLIMSPADELFHLVLHRAFGRFATLFHVYEIRRLWAAATPQIREETMRRAVDHHFAGAFALTSVALEARWGEKLPGEADLPGTWLGWRIGPRLYEAFEELSDPGRELPLWVRVRRRWIDFQLTDRPADAGRFLRIMLRVAWAQLRSQGWKTVKVKRVKSGPG
jgi:hypothetical protein